MNWNDEELDEIFKDASQQMKAPVYQDSFFDEIVPLLPKKRSRKGFYWIFASVSVLLVSGTAFFLTNSSNSISSKGKVASTKDVKLNGDFEFKDVYIASETNTSSSQVSGKTQNLSEKSTKIKANSRENKENISSKELSVTQINKTVEFDSKKSSVIVEENNQVQNDDLSNKENVIGTQIKTEHLGDISKLNYNKYSLLDNNLNRGIMALVFPVKRKTHFIDAELASGFSENFVKSSNSSLKPIFVQSLGVNYQYRKKHYAFSAGINWMNYKPDNLNLNRQSKVYGFDVTHYTQTIDYKWISMIQVPISVQKLFKNQQFSVGIAPSFMLGSVIQFSKTQNGTEIENSKIYGNKIGLKNFGLSPQISYGISVLPDFEIGMRVSTHLINPIDNTRFTGDLTKFPFQAQLTLKKYFSIR